MHDIRTQWGVCLAATLALAACGGTREEDAGSGDSLGQVVQVADAPYAADNCKEQGFIDYSKQAAR